MTQRRRVGHDGRVLAYALLSGFPGVVLSLWMLFRGDLSTSLTWTLAPLVLFTWLGFSWGVREQVVDRLHVLANLLGALREGDFSMRGRVDDAGGALGQVLDEVNRFGETLRAQRLGAVEATALLSRVMAEIDVAVFAFDAERRLCLCNRPSERLLGRPVAELLGQHAEELGMARFLDGDATRTVEGEFGTGTGPWELRRRSFRQEGRPHELVVLADLERARREEEREAWQRLIRVLGHEINNSLTPIQSIAQNLRLLVHRRPRPTDWEDDVGRGLEVVERRSEALGRFLGAYARLAKLPSPRLAPVDVTVWVRRVADLEKRIRVSVVEGPPLLVLGDSDQLDQLLINIVRNAVDATLETAGGVAIGWRVRNENVEVVVTDDGPGISDTKNLFVPFFTTKPGGSGIGLALSRQIAEAHRGRLELRNRNDARGCEAILRLPS